MIFFYQVRWNTGRSESGSSEAAFIVQKEPVKQELNVAATEHRPLFQKTPRPLFGQTHPWSGKKPLYCFKNRGFTELFQLLSVINVLALACGVSVVNMLRP